MKFHHLQLTSLLSCDVDFILAETINTIQEAHVLLRLCHEMEIPLIISLVTNGRGQLLSGEKLDELAIYIKKFSPVGISLNCRSIAELLKDTKQLAAWYPGIKGVYSNAPGMPHPVSGWLAESDAANQLEDFVRQTCKLDYRIFGGCCGTNPEMIHALSNVLQNTFKSKLST
jgi:5-methyltetrahydrofolate--homocysteine methyltransferase